MFHLIIQQYCLQSNYLSSQGAPQLEFLAGRPNATAPAIDGLIPEPQDSVTSILTRFDDAGGFTPFEVISLLASHTVARADHVDPTLDAAPFDSVSHLSSFITGTH